jgi:hypothetical protein
LLGLPGTVSVMAGETALVNIWLALTVPSLAITVTMQGLPALDVVPTVPVTRPLFMLSPRSRPVAL